MPKEISNNFVLLILFAIIALSLFNCASGNNMEGYTGGQLRSVTQWRNRHYPYWYYYYYNRPSRYYWWSRLQRLWPYGYYNPNYYYY